MTRPCSNSRSYSILSLLLALCLYLPGLQAAVPLRAFTATYTLQVGGLSPGTAQLSLKPFKKIWRWRLTTRATGIYAMFIRKQPYSETTFSQTRGDPRLQSILITDARDEKNREFASFNWDILQMQISRKGKKRQQPLKQSVYDYQSIHLLAADMQLRQQQLRSVHFYRRGKLVDSRLSYLGDQTLDIRGKPTLVRVYQQTFDVTDDEMRYYYAANNPLLPLIIEKLENDESPSTLTLQKVVWHS